MILSQEVQDFDVIGENTIGFDYGSLHIELIEDEQTKVNKLCFIVFFADEEQKYYATDSFSTFEQAWKWYQNQYDMVISKKV